MLYCKWCRFQCFKCCIVIDKYFAISTKMDTEDTYESMFEEVGESWDESEIRALITLVKANEFLVNKTEKDFWNKEKR